MSLVAAMAIGVGGALGAVARAVTGRVIRTSWPLATLVVNVAGSFILAAAYAGLSQESDLGRALLGSGFCGALTTFSTFILETVILLRSRQWLQASLYVAATLALCSLASWLGYYLLG